MEADIDCLRRKNDRSRKVRGYQGLAKRDRLSPSEKVIDEMRDTLTVHEWLVIGGSLGLFDGIQYSTREISQQLGITILSGYIWMRLFLHLNLTLDMKTDIKKDA